MKIISQKLVTATLFFIGFMLISCSDNESTSTPNDISVDTNTSTSEDQNDDQGTIDIPGTIRNITPMDFVAEMGIGWNLGNSLDVTNVDKTAWGNPLPSQEIIDIVYNMGFRTLRIPVTWRFNQQSSAPYTIDANYLTQVQETVNYGISKNMHVIINIHHDNTWVRPTTADAPQVKERLASLWNQVATRFRAYGDMLIFETLNENRLLNSPEEWIGGTEEGRTVLNEYHEEIVNTIRATGGNNQGRMLMISTYAASTLPVAMDGLEIPNNDQRIIISLHTYFPWPFAGPEDALAEWGSDQDKAQLEEEFDRIHNKWIVQEQHPVILGEWGAVDKNNLNTREAYYQFYVEQSTARGLLPIVWDDGGDFRMLNRSDLVWYFPTLAETIVDAAN